MTETQANKIIELLQKLVDNSTHGDSVVPWTVALLRELGTGEDQDANGLVYGTDFIFDHVTEWLPLDLQGVQENLRESFKGKKITVLEYAESLDSNDPRIEKIYEFSKKKRSLNG